MVPVSMTVTRISPKALQFEGFGVRVGLLRAGFVKHANFRVIFFFELSSVLIAFSVKFRIVEPFKKLLMIPLPPKIYSSSFHQTPNPYIFSLKTLTTLLNANHSGISSPALNAFLNLVPLKVFLVRFCSVASSAVT